MKYHFLWKSLTQATPASDLHHERLIWASRIKFPPGNTYTSNVGSYFLRENIMHAKNESNFSQESLKRAKPGRIFVGKVLRLQGWAALLFSYNNRRATLSFTLNPLLIII